MRCQSRGNIWIPLWHTQDMLDWRGTWHYSFFLPCTRKNPVYFLRGKNLEFVNETVDFEDPNTRLWENSTLSAKGHTLPLVFWRGNFCSFFRATVILQKGVSFGYLTATYSLRSLGVSSKPYAISGWMEGFDKKGVKQRFVKCLSNRDVTVTWCDGERLYIWCWWYIYGYSVYYTRQHLKQRLFNLAVYIHSVSPETRVDIVWFHNLNSVFHEQISWEKLRRNCLNFVTSIFSPSPVVYYCRLFYDSCLFFTIWGD